MRGKISVELVRDIRSSLLRSWSFSLVMFFRWYFFRVITRNWCLVCWVAISLVAGRVLVAAVMIGSMIETEIIGGFVPLSWVVYWSLFEEFLRLLAFLQMLIVCFYDIGVLLSWFILFSGSFWVNRSCIVVVFEFIFLDLWSLESGWVLQLLRMSIVLDIYRLEFIYSGFWSSSTEMSISRPIEWRTTSKMIVFSWGFRVVILWGEMVILYVVYVFQLIFKLSLLEFCLFLLLYLWLVRLLL